MIFFRTVTVCSWCCVGIALTLKSKKWRKVIFKGFVLFKSRWISPQWRQVNSLLLLPAPVFRNCVVKHCFGNQPAHPLSLMTAPTARCSLRPPRASHRCLVFVPFQTCGGSRKCNISSRKIQLSVFQEAGTIWLNMFSPDLWVFMGN